MTYTETEIQFWGNSQQLLKRLKAVRAINAVQIVTMQRRSA